MTGLLLVCTIVVAICIYPVRAETTSPARVALVTILRPDDDVTLIEDATRGLQQARVTFGKRISTMWVPLRIVPAKGNAPQELPESSRNTFRRVAQSSDLVIAWGDLLTDAAIAAAAEFPKVRFILISTIYVREVPHNLTEASFEQKEEAFLAGAAAARKSRSHRIGFIGPIDLGPKIGYMAGAYFMKTETRVIVDFLGLPLATSKKAGQVPHSWLVAGHAGSSEPTYHEPRKAEEVALAQFDRGADVIYTAAGASNSGTYKAAAHRHRWVVGTGGYRSEHQFPQAWRDWILTIITEHPDLAVHEFASIFMTKGRFPPHVALGVGFAPMPVIGFTEDQYTQPHLGAIAASLYRITEQIRQKKITVPQDEGQLSEFLARYRR